MKDDSTRMGSQFVNYCIECEWGASTDQHTREELSTLTVEHACRTGHDVKGKRPEDDREDLDDHNRRQDAMETDAEEPSRSGETTGEHVRVYSVSDSYRSDREEGTDDGSGDRGHTDTTSEALTRGDFEAELRRLLRHAYRSGIPIEGCDARFPGHVIPDYTIEIHELQDK